jgi:glycosyltransferase involved in cell wall biosynthesis
MEKGKIPCTAQVLTYNSASTLTRCLEGLQAFDDILVLDGGSTDATHNIAQRFGARILPQREDGSSGPITDFSAVRNRGLSLAKYDWFMYLDGDEYISLDFASAVSQALSRNTAEVYRVPRLHVLPDGRVIRSGSTYPNYQIRLFRRSAVNPFKKKVHEQVHPKRGVTIANFACALYVPLEPIEELRRKWSTYLDLQVVGLRPTWQRLFSGLRSNAVKFAVYFSKTLYAYCLGKRPHMPLTYEWENALYHLRLIHRMTKHVLRNKFHL